MAAGRPDQRDDRAAARGTQREGGLGSPLTPAQLKALHAAFWHLGYDRDARLAAAAAALGQEQPLASFNDLTEGQAGILLQTSRGGNIRPYVNGARIVEPSRTEQWRELGEFAGMLVTGVIGWLQNRRLGAPTPPMSDSPERASASGSR
jgi:hypothetical protein